MLQASLQVTLSENDTQFCQLNQNTKSGFFLNIMLKTLAYKQKMYKKAING